MTLISSVERLPGPISSFHDFMDWQICQPKSKKLWTEQLTMQRFLDDILIVSKGNETEHGKLVETVLKSSDDKKSSFENLET